MAAIIDSGAPGGPPRRPEISQSRIPVKKSAPRRADLDATYCFTTIVNGRCYTDIAGAKISHTGIFIEKGTVPSCACCCISNNLTTVIDVVGATACSTECS